MSTNVRLDGISATAAGADDSAAATSDDMPRSWLGPASAARAMGCLSSACKSAKT